MPTTNCSFVASQRHFLILAISARKAKEAEEIPEAVAIVAAAAMSTFAAVDLDAVLDDFEDSVNRAKQEEHSPPDKEGAKRPLRGEGEGEDGSGGEATKVLADPPKESEEQEEGKIGEVAQSHDLDEEDQVVGRPKVAVGDLISVEDEIGVVPELTGLGIAEESGVEEEAAEAAAAVKGPLEEEIVPGASRQDPPAPPSVDRSASPEFISIYDQAQVRSEIEMS